MVAGRVILLGTFWMLEEYASAVGRGRAQEVARNVNRLARTVVLSPTPLGIKAPGVREERIGAAGSPDVRSARLACGCWPARRQSAPSARRVVAADRHGHRASGQPTTSAGSSPADRRQPRQASTVSSHRAHPAGLLLPVTTGGDPRFATRGTGRPRTWVCGW